MLGDAQEQVEGRRAELGDGDTNAQQDIRARGERLSTASLLVPPTVVFVASRALLAFLGHDAPRLVPVLNRYPILLPHTDPLARLWSWVAPWMRFDTGWYVGIAEHGYHWGPLGKASTNFMPLYPVLIRLLQPITLGSAWLSALVVANLAFLAALIVIWRWTQLRWDQATGIRVLLLVTVFPFSLFFATAYAEPLFLFLAAASFLLAEEERWGRAIAVAGLASVTRPVGAAVVLGLVVMALHRNDRRHALLAWTGLAPLVAFAIYLGLAFGHPLAFLTYHSAGWVPPHGGLLETVVSQFQTRLAPFDRIDAALAAIFLASGILIWRRIGPGYAVYVVAGVLLPLVHGLVSMERYVIVLFPAMAAWAIWNRRIVQLIFAVSVAMFILASTLFAAGYAIF